MKTIEDAIILATNAHKGQTQKDGSPYILHPLALMNRFPQDFHAQMVAVLHDVVEDTPVTLDDLAGFPPEVVAAVDALTHRDDESYEVYIERVKTNKLAVRVKIADLEHNMDVRRLPEVTKWDRARLEKYRRVWLELNGL